MTAFLAIFVILGLIILANLLARQNNTTYRRWFDGLLLVVNLPLALFGTAVLLLPSDLLRQLQQPGTPNLNNTAAYGGILVGMGIWGILSALRPIRDWFARVTPLNPTSPVHAVALMLSGYLAGSTLLTLSQGGLEGLAETAVSATVGQFVLQQVLFVLIGVLGVGALIRRNGPQLIKRLGLERPSWPQIKTGLRWIAILVLLQWLFGVIWMLLDPEQAQLLEGISDVLLGDFDTLGEWIILALAAGIGEEILFRGAMQPVLGLGFTSAIFAVSHIQYGFTPATLLVFVISVVLGIVRRRTNTTTAIFVHAGYDFTLGLLFLIARYASQFA